MYNYLSLTTYRENLIIILSEPFYLDNINLDHMPREYKINVFTHLSGYRWTDSRNK